MRGLENVALTVEASGKAERLKNMLGLRETRDVVRLGVAVALRERLSAQEPEDASYGGTNYYTDGVDPDHHLRRAIQVLHPDMAEEQHPDRVLRVLMSRGVMRLSEDLEQGRIDSLADVVSSAGEAGLG